MTPEEMAQAQQQMRMSQQQQALAQQQTRALREQAELARAQQLALQQMRHQSSQSQQSQAWEQIQAGDVPTDKELRQVLHELDLKQYGAQSPKEQLEAEALGQYMEQRIAQNMVAHARRTAEGQVLMQGIPVRSQDAFQAALSDIKHFRDTGSHLPPSKLRAFEGLGPNELYFIQDTNPAQTQENLGKAFGNVSKTVADYAILDDLRTLQDPNAPLLEKAIVAGQFIPAAKLAKIAKPLAKVVGKDGGVLKLLKQKGLNDKQIKKYKEFVDSFGGKAKRKIEVYNLPNGGKAFLSKEPARDIPSSSTIYQKQVDVNGKTIIFEHTTYDSNGKIVHTKQKFPTEVKIP